MISEKKKKTTVGQSFLHIFNNSPIFSQQNPTTTYITTDIHIYTHTHSGRLKHWILQNLLLPIPQNIYWLFSFKKSHQLQHDRIFLNSTNKKKKKDVKRRKK